MFLYFSYVFCHIVFLLFVLITFLYIFILYFSFSFIVFFLSYFQPLYETLLCPFSLHPVPGCQTFLYMGVLFYSLWLFCCCCCWWSFYFSLCCCTFSHIWLPLICFFIFKNEGSGKSTFLVILVSNTGFQIAAPLSGNSEREFCLQRQSLCDGRLNFTMRRCEGGCQVWLLPKSEWGVLTVSVNITLEVLAPQRPCKCQ